MRIKVFNNRVKIYGNRLKYYYPNESKAYVDVIQADVALTATQRLYAHFMIGVDINEMLWILRNAYYLLLGGTPSTHKWNAKDLRNLDAAFRLTFPAGMSHSANGMQGDAASQYAVTFLNPSLVLTLNNTHLSVYTNTEGSSANLEIGCFQAQIAGYSHSFNLLSSFNGVAYSDHYNTNPNDGRVSSSVSNGIGYTLGNRNGFFHKIYKNGIEIASAFSTSSTGLPNAVLEIFRFNAPTPRYSSKSTVLVSIGAAFNNQQAMTDSTKTIFGQKILNRA